MPKKKNVKPTQAMQGHYINSLPTLQYIFVSPKHTE